MTAGGRWKNPGSWRMYQHALGLVGVQFQPIVAHPGIGSVKTGLERLFKELEATVSGEKEDGRIICKEDSADWRKD